MWLLLLLLGAKLGRLEAPRSLLLLTFAIGGGVTTGGGARTGVRERLGTPGRSPVRVEVRSLISLSSRVAVSTWLAVADWPWLVVLSDVADRLADRALSVAVRWDSVTGSVSVCVAVLGSGAVCVEVSAGVAESVVVGDTVSPGDTVAESVEVTDGVGVSSEPVRVGANETVSVLVELGVSGWLRDAL